MSLRARLGLGLAGIAVVLVLPAVFATAQLNDLKEIALELRQQEAAAQQAVNSVRTALDRTDRYARSYVATLDSPAARRLDQALAEARSSLEELEAAGYGSEARSPRALVAALASGADGLDSLARTARSDGTVTGPELEEATEYFRALPPLLTRTRQSLTEVDLAIRRRSTVAARRAEAISGRAVETTLLALGIAFTLAALLATLLTRHVTRPVEGLRASMQRVADGEFDPPERLAYDRSDEFGELNRSFRSMTEQLAELDKMKSEFVSMASHRLKTPINVLNGYLEMFVDGTFGSVSSLQADALDEMREQIRRLIEQVNQLMELSRVEAGAMSLEFETVAVADVLTGIEQAFEAHARQKSVEFVVEREDSAPETLEADPDRIRDELLGNLLSNAFKYVEEGDEVRVVARGVDDRLELEVADTGPGIPADDLDQIFEKYYQVEEGGDELSTGLGLAIAREIAESHGGAIEAESEPGRGTVFRIRLPLRRSD